MRYLIPILLLATAGPAVALTIEPGTYQMEWRIPPADEAPSSDRMYGSLEPIPAEQARLAPSLVSSRPMWATNYEYVIVLDESKGTGTGYDLAYVATAPEEDKPVDLATALKIPLVRDESSGDLKGAREPEIDVRLGDAEHSVTKKARLAVEVGFDQDNNVARAPSSAYLTRCGGWYGTLKSDEGDLSVTLLDYNSNRAYGDRSEVLMESGRYTLADALLISRGGPAESACDGEIVHLAEVVCYEDHLYLVDVDPTGQSLSIRPYQGDTGTIRAEAKDGYGRPSSVSRLGFVGTPGLFDSNGSTVRVPPGKYTGFGVSVSIGKPNEKTPRAFTLHSNDRITVTRDGVGIVRVGGKPHIEIEPGKAVVKVRRGEMLFVRMAITVGSSEMTWTDQNAVVNIRNSRGKLLLSGTAHWDWHDGGHLCIFHIPANWKPGRYTIGTSLDLSPYYKPVFDKIEMRVVK